MKYARQPITSCFNAMFRPSRASSDIKLQHVCVITFTTVSQCVCTYLKLVCEELQSEGNQLEKKLKQKDTQDDKTEAMEHQPGVNATVTSNCR